VCGGSQALKPGKPDWASDAAVEYMTEAFHRQGRWFTEVLVPLLVGTEGLSSPRHQTHFEPSIFE
jgi:hypothetical protein